MKPADRLGDVMRVTRGMAWALGVIGQSPSVSPSTPGNDAVTLSRRSGSLAALTRCPGGAHVGELGEQYIGLVPMNAMPSADGTGCALR